MGKTYIDTVKYVVHAQMEIDGIVEKPDVVGAIFGQTEGLLGEELDLRELQKSGRIGRIDVNVKVDKGKSIAEMALPSSLDRVETAILAAALETVDRVGPCEAKVTVNKIEDTRFFKREHVVNRAQNILKDMIQQKVPESREISDKVRDEVKTAEVCEYGPEKLSCGPELMESEEIIIVEGRADVITLLKADIKNAIAVQGKNIPPSVAELTKQKTVTVFVDGDRGGDLILKQMEDTCEIEFVTKAPDGKEVEELTKKEILKCLRHRMPYPQFMERFNHNDRPSGEYPRRESRTYERRDGRRPMRDSRTDGTRGPMRDSRTDGTRGPRDSRTDGRSRPEDGRRPSRDDGRSYDRRPRDGPRAGRYDRAPVKREPNPYEEKLNALKGSLKGTLLNENDEAVIETDVRNLSAELENKEGIKSVVFDGIITQRLVDLANKKGLKYLVGIRQTKIENGGGVKVITDA